jgi:2,4-dienoyl-CoA reductase (NADPH2)
MKDLLFEPITLGGLEVKNRIFMPAMHLNMCRNFKVTERLLAFYAERAPHQPTVGGRLRKAREQIF